MTRVLEGLEERAKPQSTNWLIRRLQTWRQFFHDVKLEMRRVTWPTRQDVYGTTLVTVLVVFFFGYFLWGTNWVLSYLVDSLIKHFTK